MYPGDTIRRRMQNNGAGGAEKVYSSTWHCTTVSHLQAPSNTLKHCKLSLVQVIFKQEGISGFFRGAWTNTIRCVPGASIQFGAYELMKGFLGC